MTLTEAKKLKVGDTVVWPEGVRGCTSAYGTVIEDVANDALLVRWRDGQFTYLHDARAVACIERVVDITKASATAAGV